MNKEHSCKISWKNSKWLLKNLQKNGRGLLFFDAPCRDSKDFTMKTFVHVVSCSYLQSPWKTGHNRQVIWIGLNSLLFWSYSKTSYCAKSIKGKLWGNWTVLFGSAFKLSKWQCQSTEENLQQWYQLGELTHCLLSWCTNWLLKEGTPLH